MNDDASKTGPEREGAAARKDAEARKGGEEAGASPETEHIEDEGEPLGANFA